MMPRWRERQDLLHGFLGRRGGKSRGPYESLNLSFRVGDDPRIVKDNLCDMKKAVGMHDLRVVTMRQVHGDRIVAVRDKSSKEAGEADGMVTEEAGLFLGVLTADCVPILFAARQRKLAAVVHAGWRGTLSGISAKMISLLRSDYGIPPEDVEVGLGPAIGGCCYEVGRDVAGPMAEKWGDLVDRCVRVENSKTFLDLRGLNRGILVQCGISPGNIQEVGPCTSCARAEFFSYRREKKETGRQISFIGWNS